LHRIALGLWLGWTGWLGGTIGAAAGARLLPPPGFEADPDLPRGPTAAAAPSLDLHAPRRVEQALVDRGQDRALVLARVEAPLEATEEVKDALAVVLAVHYRWAAGAETIISWANPPHGSGRIDMAATLAFGERRRALRLAFVPAGDHHFVLSLTGPPERPEELEPVMRAALEGFHPDASGSGLAWRQAAIGIALGVTVLLVVAAVTWLRFRPDNHR
jgi:hypothetical protein